MEVYKHRTKNVVVIKCENQSEKSALCRYPYNIDLRATDEELTFFASTLQITDFEEFKKEVLK